MFGIHRTIRYSMLVLVAIVMGAGATPSRAVTGAVRFTVTRAGFIVGVGGGSGVLVFQGRRYPLSVGGLGVGFTVGASKADLVGRALNMRQASDIEGIYSAIGAGIAVAGGGTGVRLQNS